ncbi:MAG: phosphatase PAP2 family protein [Prevotellaceae bacterium]|nr:phosphatase PAP2 family protein [Prevotellaceae bacterium]
MIKKIVIIIICFATANFAAAQTDTIFVADSAIIAEISEINDTLPLIANVDVQAKNPKSKTDIALSFAIPSALITYGIITRFTPKLQNFDHITGAKIKQNIYRKYTFDDYIQYAPYIAIFGLDLCKVRAKHGFWERALVTATGVLIMGTVVSATKYTTHIERPDGSNFHSFPSGHTATAFLGAHILFREYRDVSPWIGVAGYAAAFTTGAMRMINQKHWFSDVVTGAGVGVLSAELSYLLLPAWRKLFKIKPRESSVIITPAISHNQAAISGIWVF